MFHQVYKFAWFCYTIAKVCIPGSGPVVFSAKARCISDSSSSNFLFFKTTISWTFALFWFLFWLLLPELIFWDFSENPCCLLVAVSCVVAVVSQTLSSQGVPWHPKCAATHVVSLNMVEAFPSTTPPQTPNMSKNLGNGPIKKFSNPRHLPWLLAILPFKMLSGQ